MAKKNLKLIFAVASLLRKFGAYTDPQHGLLVPMDNVDGLDYFFLRRILRKGKVRG